MMIAAQCAAVVMMCGARHSLVQLLCWGRRVALHSVCSYCDGEGVLHCTGVSACPFAGMLLGFTVCALRFEVGL